MNQQKLAYFFALFTIVVWSSTFVLTKVVLLYITPIELLILRYVTVVLFLTLIYPKYKIYQFKEEVSFALAGGFLSFYFLFENTSLNYTNSSNVSLIIATIPIQTLIIKRLFLKATNIDKIQLVGIVVSYIGVVMIVLFDSVFAGLKPTGDFLALLAAFTFVLYSLFLEKTNIEIHLIVRTRKIFFYGLLVIFVFVLMNGNFRLDNIFTPIVISSVFYLGIVASGVCFLMWNYSVKVLGSLKTNVFTYMIPFFTLIIAYLAIDEHLTFAKIVGGMIIVLGVYLSEKIQVEKDDL